MKNILITSALPYSNGLLHLGHILEFVQSDIWARYNRQFFNKCIFISGNDTHGTPVMLKSRDDNVSADYIVNKYELLHKKTLKKFYISCDEFYNTHSYENENLSRRFFYRLNDNDLIIKKIIYQLYDIEKKIFLPDRYIVGSCPNCFSTCQYGDVCEKCSYKYESINLLDPVSVISKTTPIKRYTKHYFFNLSKFEKFLSYWCSQTIKQKTALNKLNEWLSSGLKFWNISRDIPYFGFKIPDKYDKYFYVWLDAPIGYLSSFQKFIITKSFYFIKYLLKNSKFEIHHFIGKDILYFHSFFWPCILKSCKIKLPTTIFIHGFLTIQNKKMSKSNKIFIKLEKLISNTNAEFLRYYFASKLNKNINDIDFNILDFINKINSDLINKFLNIFSRCCKIITSNYNSILSDKFIEPDLFSEYIKLNDIIITLYQKKEYSKIISLIMKYASKINIYLEYEKPWFLLKYTKTQKRAHEVCTVAINLFLILLINIKPIIPNISEKIEDILCLSNLSWFNFKKPLINRYLKDYYHIVKKLNKY